ncbi:MAG: indolepyruvate ferredoxin oxidoreductase [Bacteroidaceae bacterium]|nr:indolepyruvate ferredoxin oxidoreductase [Bacteroidaceae bacterium]
MAKKQLLLGDEAIALGAINAGLSGVYAYPGTPSTEVTEYIQNSPLARERGIHSRWSTNEKTAMEAALGMSYMGKRAMVCMKHVGLNVCMDPFVNSGMTGVNGGVVVLVADDPSMHSSQDEQDSRFLGSFAMIPMLEPSTQQEAYDMMAYAFDLSEKEKTPVLMRVVTRMAHSRAVVEVAEEARKENELNYKSEAKDWVLLPGNARRKNALLCEKQKDFEEESATANWNKMEEVGASLGIICSGIAYNYVSELFAASPELKKNVCILKISQYPLPKKTISALCDKCEKILVAEDGQPFIEEKMRGILPQDKWTIYGRMTGHLPRTGELTPDSVAKAIGRCLAEITGVQFEEYAPTAVPEIVAPRPPALCQGCGHRSVYEALNLVLKEYDNARVFGDIGCYTLGFLPPFCTLSSCVDMGASITMAKGASDAGQHPAVAIIGDSTFTHSGMTGLLDAINENANITVVISDNLTTAMTGGQDSAGLNKYEAICIGLGADPAHVRVVVPLPKNMDEITQVIREEIDYNGVSIIIPRRECLQTLARHLKEKKKQA